MGRVSSYDPSRVAESQARIGQADQRLTLDQERLLLDRAKAIEQVAATRFKVETARREAISSAQAISALGDVDPTSATYAKDRAKIMSNFPDALGNATVREVLGKTDQMFISHQSAQQNLELEKQKDVDRKALAAQKDQPLQAGRNAAALEHLSTALKNVHALASGADEIPKDVSSAMQVIVDHMNSLKAAPAATTPTTDAVVPPSAAISAAPVAVTPAPVQPAATPAQISASSATDFLAKALGQTPAAPAATPQPVQATAAGLPDEASKALENQ